MKVSTVGLDLAKNVFQVHAVDEAGEVIVRKALRQGRGPPSSLLQLRSAAWTGDPGDTQPNAEIERCDRTRQA
jgi:hypothetical protein